MADEKKHKHLEFIQGVINRLAGNSFLLKGWSVTLISALCALSVANGEYIFVWIAIIPTISFWILDGYYLYMERLYRGLYDRVRESSEDVDYSMKVSFRYKEWCKVCFSLTLVIFYGVLTLVVALTTLAVVLATTYKLV